MKYEGTNYKFDMKYVKIAYFDMLFAMSFYVDNYVLQAGQDMKFTVDQNNAFIRFVAPQVVIFYVAPPVLALQPEHACMTLRNVEI